MANAVDQGRLLRWFFRPVAWILMLVAGVIPICLSPPCLAAEPTLEYQVKAAFLLNFTRFVDWPPYAFADPQAPVEICIFGKDPFGHVLDDVVQGEVVNGRRIEIRRITAPPASQTCHVLFVDPAAKDMRKIVSRLAPTVLTVSEGESFLAAGGMIALVVDDRRVRFDINERAADNDVLKLSSKLLSVARAVRK